MGESLSLRRDRDHCPEELEFLQQMVGDEEAMFKTLCQSNAFLENSYQELEGHTDLLESQRKSLIEEVHREKELVRQEERKNAEFRNKLEYMRRQVANDIKTRQAAME